MSQTKRYAYLLNTVALLASFALVACADKRPADSTTAVTPPGTIGTRAAPTGPERVTTLLREHNEVVELINAAGLPNERWDTPKFEAFRKNLDRLDQIEQQLAKLDDRYADEMRRSGHAERIASKREALEQAVKLAGR